MATSILANNQVSPSNYSSSGLSYSNFSYEGGGYCRIGKLVVINIRGTVGTSGDVSISNFPKYNDISLSEIIVGVVINNSDYSVSGCRLTELGDLTFNGVANARYKISVFYLGN